MSNTNDFNSAAAGSSSSNAKTYPDNVSRMSDVSTLSSEAQSSGMTTSCLEGGVLGKYNIAIKDKEILLELGISLLS
ncbi:hypothetical protein G6F26_014203 [Rhizopus arrhizus]|nr:hypothetical protein G6F23_014985 [Rhizopus arrhizus]KAG0803071.1 hypothetical protein G6F20_013853 [Rhizopus arrhizus]KAG0808786.1 hypothetical protein G6F19_013687 [Rhizopus arrhizus]KAG0810324.1 hypothetical protein G6F18_013615 [Rhizopus arrhizus]KAG0837411.1 hypothetical protein G6F17_013850 [Rhizopus arrhizus]